MLNLNLPFLDIVARITTAVVFGAVVGAERHVRRKPAGIRTLMLVGLGAAIFVLAIDELIAGTVDPRNRLSVLGRVVAGVIGGIGFLGAGTILRIEHRVEGVTTAAAIWVTAGIGVTCGLGELGLAGLFTLSAIITLTALRAVERAVPTLDEDRSETDSEPR